MAKEIKKLKSPRHVRKPQEACHPAYIRRKKLSGLTEKEKESLPSILKRLFAKKIKITKKQRKEIAIAYMANPENPIPTRKELSRIMGYSFSDAIYHVMALEEINALYVEAAEIRKKVYAKELMQVKSTLLDKAVDGEMDAIKLALQYFEQWAPLQKTELSGKDGGPIEVKSEITMEEAAQLYRKVLKK